MYTLTIAHNKAKFSGGGIYGYRSELHFVGNVHMVGNHADRYGGGVFASGTTVKLSHGKTHFVDNPPYMEVECILK